MGYYVGAALLSFAHVSAALQFADVPTGFDNVSNGVADDVTHEN